MLTENTGKGSAMKQLAVLSVVLGVIGASAAGLSLVALGGGQVGIDLDPATNVVYFFAADMGLTLSDYALTENAGGEASVQDYGSFDWSGLGLSAVGSARTFEIASDGMSGEPVLPGIQFIATFDLPAGHFFAAEPAEGAHAEARVDLITTEPSVILGTLYVVPEPMTLGLLSVGALLLRRRR